jgi:hypothetical protein
LEEGPGPKTAYLSRGGRSEPSPSEGPGTDLSTVGAGGYEADDRFVRIYVNDRTRLAELQAALSRAHCVLVAIAEDALEVTHPCALDTREELVELTFFVRAWQATRPDVEVTF